MISVVIPSYQESSNLIKILPRLTNTLNDIGTQYEILVIDTEKSLDNTESVCLKYHSTYINREGGNQYGDAIRTGFSRACGDLIVVMDADGSHNPEDIKKFYEAIKTEKYDLIIGSRYCKGGQTDNSFILVFMSWILNITYRLFFNLKVHDVSNSFRMYRGYQVKELKLQCENFDIVEEILILLNSSTKNFRIKEIPILFNKRICGSSKRDLTKFIISYLDTIKRLLRIKREISNNE